MLSDNEKIDWLRLIRTENIGPVTFKTLLKNFGSVAKVIEILPELSKKGGSKKEVSIFSKDLAEKEILATEKIGGRLVFLSDDDYPKELKLIYDAPPVISVLGRFELLKSKMFAIVGSRHSSINGANITRKIAFDLSKSGYAVVSGLALGIDGFAHQGAIEEKGSTVAVLGSGVDVPYPLENKKLYNQIREKGLIVSEFALSEEPKKSNFPRRNRIISGLSTGVLVVEATEKSGSLITVKYANEQGKDVFAIPGFPFDPRCKGPNNLIKQGAIMVRDSDDIFDEINSLSTIKSLIREEDADYFVEIEKLDDKDIDETREKIINLLSASEISVDDLIIECQKSPQAISIALVELELAGLINRTAGNKVCKVF